MLKISARLHLKNDSYASAKKTICVDSELKTARSTYLVFCGCPHQTSCTPTFHRNTSYTQTFRCRIKTNTAPITFSFYAKAIFCCVSTALGPAARYIAANVFEQLPALVVGASLHSEGELHLGCVYAADPEHKTRTLLVIAADASHRDLRVVSPDKSFELYGCKVVW